MNEYVPGQCNIGLEERVRRRNFGWVSLAVGVVVLVALLGFRVNPLWRLFLFLPATAAASGFLQAYFHFCSGFARTGVYNFGPPGPTTAIVEEDSKRKDRRKGNQITFYAVLIGAAVAILCLAIT
jgi:hypothetical protein